MYREARFIYVVIYVFVNFPIQSMSENDSSQALDFYISKQWDNKGHSSAEIPVYFLDSLPM